MLYTNCYVLNQQREGYMKKSLGIPVIMLIGLFVQSAVAGPFGLDMGMSIKKIDPKAKEISSGMYKTTKVPKPHSAFEYYVVQVSKNNGLCWIKAIGKDISTSSYGIELKSAFESMNKKLSKAYGKNETTDLLMPGSIWNEPNEFMMAMIEKERFLMAIWDKEKGSKLKGNLKQVGLIAKPGGRSKGYLILEYSFSNSEVCDKEIAAQEDDAL